MKRKWGRPGFSVGGRVDRAAGTLRGWGVGKPGRSDDSMDAPLIGSEEIWRKIQSFPDGMDRFVQGRSFGLRLASRQSSEGE